MRGAVPHHFHTSAETFPGDFSRQSDAQDEPSDFGVDQLILLLCRPMRTMVVRGCLAHQLGWPPFHSVKRLGHLQFFKARRTWKVAQAPEGVLAGELYAPFELRIEIEPDNLSSALIPLAVQILDGNKASAPPFCPSRDAKSWRPHALPSPPFRWLGATRCQNSVPRNLPGCTGDRHYNYRNRGT